MLPHYRSNNKFKEISIINIMSKMNNEKLKEIVIKNRTCYYFDDIIDVNNLHLDNNLII